MIIICYTRLNHFGRVCSGDYIRYPSYTEYNTHKLKYFRKAAEFNKGKCLFVMVFMAFIFSFLIASHLIPNIAYFVHNLVRNIKINRKNKCLDEKLDSFEGLTK